MFEAILLLCLDTDAGVCRPHLLPGYEAQTESACVAHLSENPPDSRVFANLTAVGSARCMPVGQALKVSEVAPGVFVHTGHVAEPDTENHGDVSNMGFIIGDNSVAVVDAGSARWIGEALWRSIRAKTDNPVSHIIVTHMHPDHALGAALFTEAGAAVVGHAGLARALSDRQANYLESLASLIGPDMLLGTRAPPVDIEVSDVLEIDLGARALRVQAWPTAHTGTDITIHDVATDTLFAGDLVFDRHLPALDGRLVGWRAVLAQMQAMDMERVVPGHGAASLPWPDGSKPLARYLSVLEEDTRAAVEAGTRLGVAVEEIAQSEREAWQLFDAYNPRNATVSFTELEWE
ncbi:MAG: quinoprotein relay system zinc metallohydrolase 2 [Roseobacter sp.]